MTVFHSLHIFFKQLNTALQLGLVTATLGAPVFGYVDHMALHLLWFVFFHFNPLVSTLNKIVVGCRNFVKTFNT